VQLGWLESVEPREQLEDGADVEILQFLRNTGPSFDLLKGKSERRYPNPEFAPEVVVQTAGIESPCKIFMMKLVFLLSQ
jgi:hypothetical protein